MYTSNINIKNHRNPEIHWGVHKVTGKIVWIKDVEANGYACNCKCACCGVDLKACTKGTERKAHFKHRGNNGCYYSDEIAEYLKVRDIMCALTTIHLPPVGIIIGKRGQVVVPATEASIANVLCHHDANHYPPVLTAEIDGQVTRIILSFDGYYDSEDYHEFAKEARMNGWNCLSILLPHLSEGFSITKEYLQCFDGQASKNTRWIYHTRSAEAGKALRDNAIELAPTRINYGTIAHDEYACPLHKREYSGKFYARGQDCTDCEFNLSLSSSCFCMAEAHIKSLDDLEIPAEERKAQFLLLRKKYEEAIMQQRPVKKATPVAASLDAFDPQKEPGYADVCNRDPDGSTAVYDHLGGRWHWCKDCSSWMPVRNMAACGHSYGPIKGRCKVCQRRISQERLSRLHRPE